MMIITVWLLLLLLLLLMLVITVCIVLSICIYSIYSWQMKIVINIVNKITAIIINYS